MCQECIGVEDLHLHEDYDSWTINNDICVLILESEATLGPNVGAIPLPESGEEYEEGTWCQVLHLTFKSFPPPPHLVDTLSQVAGWGDTGNGFRLS